jgi:hypothetical protein
MRGCDVPDDLPVRIPLLRLGRDESPIKWWEWLFAPPLYVLLLAVLLPVALTYCLVAIPHAIIYPERRFHLYDMGTPRQVELMRRYRLRAGRLRLWRRLGRAVAFPFKRRPPRLFRSRQVYQDGSGE